MQLTEWPVAPQAKEFEKVDYGGVFPGSNARLSYLTMVSFPFVRILPLSSELK